ncbi:MAG: hypothetical protein AAF517_23535 [Planctomycetota bacterium]
MNITDAIFLFNYLFLGGRPPEEPFADGCGVDTTDDPLGCDSYPSCLGAS